MIADRQAVDPLIGSLGDSDSTVRFYAADALGKIKDARAVEPLIALLQDPEHGRAAALPLGQLGDARAVEHLVRLLDAHQRHARTLAAQALQQLGNSPEASAAIERSGCHSRIEAVLIEEKAYSLISIEQWGACLAMGEAAIGPLIDSLDHEQDAIRNGAVRALGRSRNTRAVEPLFSMLARKGNLTLQQDIVKALEQIRDARPEDPLMSEVKDRLVEAKQTIQDTVKQEIQDRKQRIVTILKSESPAEDKQQAIGAIVQEFLRSHSQPRSTINFCACGYPTSITHRGAYLGPLRELLDSKAGAGPYEVDYTCPHCGKFAASDSG
jgi:HEAT repeat protein